MSIDFTDLTTLLTHDFDTLIDVRSPAEFAEDHIPGAISMHALSDTERARVGTIYKQESPFKARKIGAALVARNVATHVETALADKDGSFRPLVYCWRGGQRSGSFALILQQIGWRADTITGGYQTYRRLVNDLLYQSALPHRFVLLDGNTGTAKTDLLARLKTRGIQTIDLEGLAAHRGSLLGGVSTPQPSQKAFETALAQHLTTLDPTQPILLEAESSKIGNLSIPPSVWAIMSTAPRLSIEAPLAARADFLTQAYDDVISSPKTLRDRLQPIRRLRGHDVVDAWEKMLDAGDFTSLASALMAEHYDPSYTKSRAAHPHESLKTYQTASLTEAARETLADAIAADFPTLTAP